MTTHIIESEESLFDCPDCGRKNFTREGLLRHKCPPGAIPVSGHKREMVLDQAKEIRRLMDDANNSMLQAGRAIVLAGLKLLEAKQSVPHGQFGPWLLKHCYPEVVVPEGKDPSSLGFWRQAQRFMEIAENVCSNNSLTAGSKLQLGDGKPDTRVGFDINDLTLISFLQTPANDLPEDLRAKQLEFWSHVDGKSQRELLGIKEKQPAGPRKTPEYDAVAEMERPSVKAVELVRSAIIGMKSILMNDNLFRVKTEMLLELEQVRVELGQRIAEVRKEKRRSH